jgi:hypothetical protein
MGSREEVFAAAHVVVVARNECRRWAVFGPSVGWVAWASLLYAGLVDMKSEPLKGGFVPR